MIILHRATVKSAEHYLAEPHLAGPPHPPL